MIVPAVGQTDKLTALRFLNDRGVEIAYTEDFNAYGRFSGGHLIGVVGFNSFNGKICAMHAAGDGNWVSRQFIQAAFEYPFVVCEMNYIMATISSANVKSVKFTKHMGFEVVTRLPHGWSDTEDMVVLSLPKHKCRWLAQEQANELVKAA